MNVTITVEKLTENIELKSTESVSLHGKVFGTWPVQKLATGYWQTRQRAS
jgi:hypothetical protein